MAFWQKDVTWRVNQVVFSYSKLFVIGTGLILLNPYRGELSVERKNSIHAVSCRATRRGTTSIHVQVNVCTHFILCVSVGAQEADV